MRSTLFTFTFFLVAFTTIARTMDGDPPMLLIENRGQVHDATGQVRTDILFTARSSNVQLFIGSKGIHYQFKERTQAGISTHVPSVELLGTSPNVEVVMDEATDYYENYYLAHCPQGITHVGSHERVVFRNVYPHIDRVITVDGHGLKYDLIVHPGGNVRDIRMRYTGANGPALDPAGGLLITTPWGMIHEDAPVTYQGTQRTPVTSRYVIDGDMITFDVGTYDPSVDLIIDPGLQWATYYGGTEDDEFSDVIVDGTGNVYATGSAESMTAIASNGLQDTLSALADAMLVKFDASGVRQWATYYGGTGYDYGNGLALSDDGMLYLAGTTSSQGLAYNGYQMINALGPPPSANDAMLVKFQPDGTRVWATYYGGTGQDGAVDVGVSDAGDVHLVGTTRSATVMASPGSHQIGLNGTEDAYLATFSSSGARLWSTYFGGSGFDSGVSLVMDDDGLFIAGSTSSSSGIALNGHQNSEGGGTDGFLARFDLSGVQQWGTYYGASGIDQITAVAVDGTGHVIIAGSTSSTDSIAFNGHQNTYGGSDSYGKDNFIACFDANGTRLWGSYYGGIAGERVVTDLAVDALDRIYLLGSTRSASGIATADGWQIEPGGPDFDAYISVFDANGSRLWATYFGGNGRDYGHALGLMPDGALAFVGYTYSTSGVAYLGHQNDFGGGTDGYLTVLDPSFSVGVRELPDTRITVVPNPTADRVRVSGLSGRGSIQLLDAAGQIVRAAVVIASEVTFDLGDRPPGAYVLLVFGASGALKHAERVVKQ